MAGSTLDDYLTWFYGNYGTPPPGSGPGSLSDPIGPFAPGDDNFGVPDWGIIATSPLPAGVTGNPQDGYTYDPRNDPRYSYPPGAGADTPAAVPAGYPVPPGSWQSDPNNPPGPGWIWNSTFKQWVPSWDPSTTQPQPFGPRPQTTPPSTQPPATSPPAATPPAATPPSAPPTTSTPPPSAQQEKFDWPSFLAKLGIAFAPALFGRKSTAESALSKAATAPYGSNLIQGFLPPALRYPLTDPYLARGVAGIGELISQPGQLSPSVGTSIMPRLASESQSIATNFRNIRANQLGATARTNTPLSIQGALGSALDTAQERAQREARMGALTESDQLRRQDLSQTYALLDAILQFTQSGRGGAITGLGQAANLAQNRQAANLAFIGDLFPKS